MEGAETEEDQHEIMFYSLRHAATVTLKEMHHFGAQSNNKRTLLLAAQFLLLVTSPFKPTAHFGLLTAVGLVTALVLDLVFLPAFIVVWERLAARFRLRAA